MADGESISLEETNKIRLSLGLKPLSLEPQHQSSPAIHTVEEEERKAYENYRIIKETESEKARQEKKAALLKKSRNQLELTNKLSGKSLGEGPDDEDLDIKHWLKRKRDGNGVSEPRESLGINIAQEYTSESLAGITVGHSVEEFEEGEATILTIKDKGVLDEDDGGDELESTALVERMRLLKNLENKKKKARYTAYENEYDEETGQRIILSKYDDQINGPKEKKFVLGQSPSISASSPPEANSISSTRKTSFAISFDHEKPMENESDYVDQKDFKIKKPKKKKSKGAVRRRNLDDEEQLVLGPNNRDSEGDTMNIHNDTAEHKRSSKRHFDETSTFLDDDELQNALAQQRRQILKKRKVVKPEDMARQLRPDESNSSEAELQEAGLVFDDTSEFVRGLELAEREGSVNQSAGLNGRNRNSQRVASIEPMQGVEVVELQNALDPSATTINRDDSSVRSRGETTITGIEEEPLVRNGMAAALEALRRKGDLGRHDPETENIARAQEERSKWLVDQQKRQAILEHEARRQRENERQSGMFNRMSQREREAYNEQQNRDRDLRESRRRFEELKSMKFGLKLEYKDDFGKDLNQKEAFKHLSHNFHGQAPGKMKTAKYLKKIEDAKRLQGSSSIADMAKIDAQRERQRRMGTAGMRLQ